MLWFMSSNRTKTSINNNTLKTNFIKYQQTYIPKESMQGSCWTDSIAASSNEKAWRCMVDNSIFDPCFETENHRVVCQVNPEEPESGVELKLTKPLPKRLFTDAKGYSRIKLENGMICHRMTGTVFSIPQGFFEYECQHDKTYFALDEVDKSKPFWKAKLIHPSFTDTGVEIKSEMVNILTVWE